MDTALTFLRPLVVIALISACTTASTFDVKATDFDQRCATPADCEAILEGSACCGCANAAINMGDIHKYAAEVQQRTASCGGTECTGNCNDFFVTCIANKCGVQSCAQPICPADAGVD